MSTVVYVAPQPQQQIPVPTTHIHHNTTVLHAPIRPNQCSYCASGSVQTEADTCCVVFLILLAIVTFPFGLVLLLCKPYTIRKRCNACRRLYKK